VWGGGGVEPALCLRSISAQLYGHLQRPWAVACVAPLWVQSMSGHSRAWRLCTTCLGVECIHPQGIAGMCVGLLCRHVAAELLLVVCVRPRPWNWPFVYCCHRTFACLHQLFCSMAVGFPILSTNAEACWALLVRPVVHVNATGTASTLTFDWVPLQQHFVHVMSSHALWQDCDL
jgi:hypothetical protein